jgi:hypothetical protein
MQKKKRKKEQSAIKKDEILPLLYMFFLSMRLLSFAWREWRRLTLERLLL